RGERYQYRTTAFLPKYQRIIQGLYVIASEQDTESEEERKIPSTIDVLNSMDTTRTSRSARNEDG
ncbi:MAG: hypothetical protein ACE5IJ_06575, partial [Thermoplasmata archaeon]